MLLEQLKIEIAEEVTDFRHKKSRQTQFKELSAKVPRSRFELPRPIRAPPPQDGASTNFATWAYVHLWYHKNKEFSVFYKSKIPF